MKRAAFAIASILCLSACNRSPEVNVTNASGEEVVQAVRHSGVMSTGMMMEPGLWQSKVTIKEMNIPGMPAGLADKMKQSFAAHEHDVSSKCLTKAEAKKPQENFFAGQDKACHYDHFTMGGGKMDMRMVCDHEGSTQTTDMTGTYTPTSYSMDVSSTASGGPQKGMVMKMHADAHRVGECPANG